MADRYNACLSKEDNGFEPYAYATALFYYDAESGYGKITQALKYHRDIGAGAFFSHMLGKELMSSELFRSVDTIIPVPLHWTRKLKRGYNQADVIAKELSTLTGALCLNGADNPLIRTRRTGSQTRLGAKQRANNVKGAFRLRNDILTGIEAKHILLVDDVFTTGATITSCHQILRSMLPEETRISAATLAFVTD